MAVQIWPPQTGHIAVFVRTVVSQQQHRISEYLVALIFDAKVVVRPSKVLLVEILISPHWIISEDHEVRFSLVYKSAHEM